MNLRRSIFRQPLHCQWLFYVLIWNLTELCHSQDAFTPNSGSRTNAVINDDISLALIIVAVVLLATFLCVCCAACRNSLCPDDQADSDAATDSPDTPNLLSCEIEINDIIPPTYSNLVAEGIIEEEEGNENRARETSSVVVMEPVTPPPNYDIVFKPSWPRSASAYVLHPERIEEVAMADLYTRQASRTSERTVRSENSINRSVSFADEVFTPDENEAAEQSNRPRQAQDSDVTSPASTDESTTTSNSTPSPQEEQAHSLHSVSESENEPSQTLSPSSESEQFENQPRSDEEADGQGVEQENGIAETGNRDDNTGDQT